VSTTQGRASRAGAAGGLAPKRLVVALIRAYQRWLSPALPPSCRFHPSCSQYALEAVTRYGALRGSWLAVRRLARCHPFHPGGFDPVP
jgi:putative membrane protein insertion efficiency factor